MRLVSPGEKTMKLLSRHQKSESLALACMHKEREREISLLLQSQVYLCRYNILGTTWSAVAVCAIQ